jgi:hypothetical protein
VYPETTNVVSTFLPETQAEVVVRVRSAAALYTRFRATILTCGFPDEQCDGVLLEPRDAVSGSIKFGLAGTINSNAAEYLPVGREL